jgi:hypothetical protein
MAATSEIKYRRALVSFFDILGFREIVRDEPPKKIASDVSLFQGTGKISAEIARGFEGRSFQFSDSIVRMMPLDSEAIVAHPGGLLFQEVYTIALACVEMAYRGVAVRGALTVGDAYFSESMMFGPAMVRAYELESKIAVYPRVIVDPEVIETFKREPLLKKDTRSVSDEAKFLQNFLRRDEDGLWFIDYLFAARDDLDSPELFLGLLANNRKHIEKVLSQRSALDAVAVKVLWAAHYHNGVLDRLIGEGRDADTINLHRIAIPAKLHGALRA